MAHMVPPAVHAGTLSQGERSVFEEFRDSPKTKDWLVLHSFDLPAHQQRFMGEIDFVVAVRGLGILCLSIKDVKSLRRDEAGSWHLGTLPPDAQGPFKRARDDMFSLKARVQKGRPQLTNLPFASAVLFTSLERPGTWTAPTEWDDFEEYFAGDLRRGIDTVCIRALSGTRQKLEASLRRPLEVVTDDQLEVLRSYLRPQLEVFETPKARAMQLETELKKYTEEQFDVLDATQANDRVLIYGPGGTGKTLLAIELARREASSGKSVLVLCYNKLLQCWLRQQLLPLRVPCRTIHSHLLKLANVSYRPDASQSFFEHELPDLVAAAFAEDKLPYPYDVLIIDEGQDVCKPAYLDSLDCSVSSGLRDGRYFIFADFERQDLFGPSGVDLATHQNTSGRTFKQPLRRNCRNTPRVGRWAEVFGELNPCYSGYRRPDDGISPRLTSYTSLADQVQKLVLELEQAKREGFRGFEIVILSPLGPNDCCASKLPSLWKQRLTELGTEAGPQFGTIQAYKGLEAPYVIITDIEGDILGSRYSLLYTAITRSVCRTSIIVSKRALGELRDILLRAT